MVTRLVVSILDRVDVVDMVSIFIEINDEVFDIIITHPIEV